MIPKPTFLDHFEPAAIELMAEWIASHARDRLPRDLDFTEREVAYDLGKRDVTQALVRSLREPAAPSDRENG